jgi:hypothetical protein
MPIVVFAFQLWWMLALRFCIPPSISFSALATAAASGSLGVDDQLNLDVAFGAGFVDDAGNPQGVDGGSGWYTAFTAAKPNAAERNTLVSAAVVAADPAGGVVEPPALPETASLKDPLCGP